MRYAYGIPKSAIQPRYWRPATSSTARPVSTGPLTRSATCHQRGGHSAATAIVMSGMTTARYPKKRFTRLSSRSTAPRTVDGQVLVETKVSAGVGVGPLERVGRAQAHGFPDRSVDASNAPGSRCP